MKLKNRQRHRRLYQSTIFPSLALSRIVPLLLFPQKIPWFSFPSFNRKLCEATVSFFSKLSRSQTVFVLGQRVSVSMVHGRTQRVRAPFRGREKNREGKLKRERLRDIILTVYSSFVTFTSSSCIWMPISLLCNTHTNKKMGHKLIKL